MKKRIGIWTAAWALFIFFLPQLATGQPALPKDTVRIHYQRKQADYSGWGLHVWGDKLNLPTRVSWRLPLMPSGEDGFGIYFDIPVYPGFEKLGFILHKRESKNVPQDMTLSRVQHGMQIWQLEDDARIYTQQPGLIKPTPVAKPVTTPAVVSKKVNKPAPTPARPTSTNKEALALFGVWRSEAEAELKKRTQEVTQLSAELAQLTERYQHNNSELSEAQQQLQLAQNRLTLAEQQHLLAQQQLQQRARTLEQKLQQLQQIQSTTSAERQQQQSLSWWLSVAMLSLLVLLLGARLLLQHRRQQHQAETLTSVRQRLQETRKEYERFSQLLVSAHQFDHLTGLLNLQHFLQRLEGAINLAGQNQRQLVVALANICHFRHLNEQFGSSYGDEVLKQIAQRLSSAVGKDELAARDHDDRFLLLIDRAQDGEQLQQRLDTLTQTLEAPLMLRQTKRPIQIELEWVSVQFPADGSSPLDLLHRLHQQLVRNNLSDNAERLTAIDA